jgi:hypothetical protein
MMGVNRVNRITQISDMSQSANRREKEATMRDANRPAPRDQEWLLQMGLDRTELSELMPCTPGSFTLQNAYYVNTATPRVVYFGTEEGTLPLVGGRWYQLPSDLVARHAELRRDAAPVARAPRLISR